MTSTKYIGTPANRVDGPAKVTGHAKYAAEYNFPGMLYGCVLSSAIAKGRIKSIDTAPAMHVEGVKQVFTHKNVSGLAWFDRSYKDQDSLSGSPFRPLEDDKIRFSMQPVALVIAETFELASYASTLIKIEYEAELPVTNLEENINKSFKAPKGKTGYKPPPSRGNAKEAFEAAPYKITAEYHLGTEHHNPMELFATTVKWEEDEKITVYDKTQGITNSQIYVANVFGLSKKDVRVISPYVGGGFGSGLRPQYQLFMAVLAALELKRSVKVILTRTQMFSFGHRPKNLQHIALSAAEDGMLLSVEHTAYGETSTFENYTENVVHWSGMMYQCANVALDYQLVKLDIFTPLDMRAPGAASGLPVLESAMDELAYELKMDPLDFRIKNYSYKNQNDDKPFSSKALMECYKQGAERFGWSRRQIEPRSMREGNTLIGWGMATGCWDSMQMKCAAKAVLSPNGKLNVSSGTSDIGTGTYTIMTQIAAETLGLPIEDVTFKLGDSEMPVAPLEGGSWTAASAGSAVKAVCEEIAQKVFRMAKKLDNTPFGNAYFKDVTFENGKIYISDNPSVSVQIKDVVKNGKEIEKEASTGPSLVNMAKYAFNTHSSVFVEVRVDEGFGTINVSRIVSAIAGGRIINPKTARSQILGAAVWGLGMALEEDTIMDHNLGRFMNHNLAEYHVAVNADVFDIDVLFVDEKDDIINPLGAKGLGEIGIISVAGAIANAVFHATGKRVRKLPITLDTLL